MAVNLIFILPAIYILHVTMQKLILNIQYEWNKRRKVEPADIPMVELGNCGQKPVEVTITEEPSTSGLVNIRSQNEKKEYMEFIEMDGGSTIHLPRFLARLRAISHLQAATDEDLEAINDVQTKASQLNEEIQIVLAHLSTLCLTILDHDMDSVGIEELDQMTTKMEQTDLEAPDVSAQPPLQSTLSVAEAEEKMSVDSAYLILNVNNLHKNPASHNLPPPPQLLNIRRFNPKLVEELTPYHIMTALIYGSAWIFKLTIGIGEIPMVQLLAFIGVVHQCFGVPLMIILLNPGVKKFVLGWLRSGRID